MGEYDEVEITRMYESLPDGVIERYNWGSRTIPISGGGSDETQVIGDAVTIAMREFGIVGCGVCIVRESEVIYSRGFGYAELPLKQFTTSTASRCGSLAKPITALCALILHDQGKLNLDAEILPILAEVGIVPKPVGSGRMDERVARIRVRYLMDHTSGLPRSAAYTAWRPDRDIVALHKLDQIPTSADVASDALGNAKLECEPGEKYQYANANYVLLARVIETGVKTSLNEFLTTVAMPRFGLTAADIYVSRNQTSHVDSARGSNEAAYYQTSSERYVSFVPEEQSLGMVLGEAYRGYATEASDGAGGLACTAEGIGRIIANLHSVNPAISARAMQEILTPPAHYGHEAGFDPADSEYYSKGFIVRYSDGKPWFSHGGMTNHCGGVIGHNAGCQFVAVSNWNNSGQPYVDKILGSALREVVGEMGMINS